MTIHDGKGEVTDYSHQAFSLECVTGYNFSYFSTKTYVVRTQNIC